MRTIGVEAAPEHAYGRQFLEGVAAFATSNDDWQLRSFTQEQLHAEGIGRYDGVIMRLLDDEAERLAHAASVPIVDIYCNKPRTGVAQIHGDFEAIGRTAATFLTNRGFNALGWCGFKGMFFSEATKSSFLAALKTIMPTPVFYEYEYEPPSGTLGVMPDKVSDCRSLRKWLKRLPKPIAIFCCNDYRAYQVMRIALDAKINVPSEISILGVDNDSVLCSFAKVSLSSVDPNAFSVGYSAARLLNTMMKNRIAKRPHHAFLIKPKGVIERKSTSYIPIDPPWLSDALVTIERNIANGITAKQVYDIAQRSAPTVERMFRTKLGQSVIGYINQAKMKKAIHLLQTSDMLTKEIAAACGFTSAQYFCRTFKSLCGDSPLKLREKFTKFSE